jgi:hypothetical protein
MCVQGLAPLVDIPELERSILGRGGNINYKHFFVKPGQADGETLFSVYAFLFTFFSRAAAQATAAVLVRGSDCTPSTLWQPAAVNSSTPWSNVDISTRLG